MKEQAEEIIKDIKAHIFDELVNMYDYWGENSLVEMIDFCNRNNLHSQKSILTKLLTPDRIK